MAYLFQPDILRKLAIAEVIKKHIQFFQKALETISATLHSHCFCICLCLSLSYSLKIRHHVHGSFERLTAKDDS